MISHRTYAKKIISSCSFFLLVTTPRLSISSAMHPSSPPKQQPKTGTSISNKLAHRLVFTSIKQGSRSHKRRCTDYESDYVPCEHQPLGIKKRSLTFLLVVEKVLNHLPHQQHSFFFCFPSGQTGQ